MISKCITTYRKHISCYKEIIIESWYLFCLAYHHFKVICKEEFNSEKQKEEEYNSFDTSDVDPKIMNQFELLWNKYPKRVGKKEVLYYYNEAIKGRNI